jgi:hypothetical protein
MISQPRVIRESQKMMSDLRFNRIRKHGQRIYLDAFDRSQRAFGEKTYTGFIKCKLVHGKRYSLVFPDQIYVLIGVELYWIQPLYLSASIISVFDHGNVCDLIVDISHGQVLRIRFENRAVVERLSDGSFLYKCNINAPQFLHRYTTGPAKLVDSRPRIKLYHHTTADSKRAILKGQHFRTSAWNIQGNKKCTNMAFLYMTSLPGIECVTDLQQIAMSNFGKMAFRLDDNFTNNADLVLDVYRESTNNRTHTIGAWVYAEHLAPQPCYRHLPSSEPGYHEVVSPFIHRMPSTPGGIVEIRGELLQPKQPELLFHTIVGDATSLDGLRAPFDEEHTNELLKTERIEPPDDITSFWVSNPNMNHYDGKKIETFAFEELTIV